MNSDQFSDQEVPVQRGTYLYSRTDRRSVILGADSTFVKLSGHLHEELIGSPSRILRHPQMPKGLFHLMWQTLQAGQPFGGFIRNRTAGGRSYWLCVVIVSSDNGYVSVATRPSGVSFDTARGIYPDMLALEEAGATPAGSAELFAERLAAAGYATVEDFMAEALAEHAGEPARPDCHVERIRVLRADLSRLAATQSELLSTLQKLYLIPTNMRILASRLEPSGGPVSAISDSYKRAASELMARLHRHGVTPGAQAVQDAQSASTQVSEGARLMGRALFLTSAAAVLTRAEAQALAHPGEGCAHSEAAMLSQLVRDFDASARDSTTAIAAIVARIAKEAEHIKRLMAGLDQIRILGEVESGRIRNADGGLAAIMAQLTSFHTLIHARLTAMSNAAARMHLERG